jgi:electron transport complex protein RnfB
MAKEVYQKLREQLDQYSVGFPKTISGVEIRMLEKIFTEGEAEMSLQLSMQLETPESVASRTGLDTETTAVLLDQMAKKGLIFRWHRDDTVKYAAVPFVLGIYEFQLNTMDKEFAQMFEDYLWEAFGNSVAGHKPNLMRTLPIHQSVDVTRSIATYEDSREIIKNQKFIAVANCICRVQQNLIGQHCDKPLEVCLLFGSAAQHYIDLDMGREITTQEALEVLDKCDEAGLVNQPANVINPGGMCNCCGDCCPLLRTIKYYARPSEMVSSNYYAVVTPEDCTACETCMDRCQMDAISIGDDDTAEVSLDRCIGCGLCVTTCDTSALRMELKPGDQRHMPREKGQDLLRDIARERGTSLIPLAMGE